MRKPLLWSFRELREAASECSRAFLQMTRPEIKNEIFLRGKMNSKSIGAFAKSALLKLGCFGRLGLPGLYWLSRHRRLDSLAADWRTL